jgi:hypothetical protein
MDGAVAGTADVYSPERRGLGAAQRGAPYVCWEGRLLYQQVAADASIIVMSDVGVGPLRRRVLTHRRRPWR